MLKFFTKNLREVEMTTVNLMHDAYRHLTGKSDAMCINQVFGKGGYVASGFSNESMRQPVKGKPHIVFIGGLWRVSKLKKPYQNHEWYGLAYKFAQKRNFEKFYEYFEKVKNERKAAKKDATGN